MAVPATFLVVILSEQCYWQLVVETRDAAEHDSPTTKNVHGAGAEKPWTKAMGFLEPSAVTAAR